MPKFKLVRLPPTKHVQLKQTRIDDFYDTEPFPKQVIRKYVPAKLKQLSIEKMFRTTKNESR